MLTPQLLSVLSITSTGSRHRIPTHNVRRPRNNAALRSDKFFHVCHNTACFAVFSSSLCRDLLDQFGPRLEIHENAELLIRFRTKYTFRKSTDLIRNNSASSATNNRLSAIEQHSMFDGSGGRLAARRRQQASVKAPQKKRAGVCGRIWDGRIHDGREWDAWWRVGDGQHG